VWSNPQTTEHDPTRGLRRETLQRSRGSSTAWINYCPRVDWYVRRVELAMIPSRSGAVLIVFAALLTRCGGPTNVIEDLGTLGGPSSLGLAINAAGNVTGASFLTADPHSGGLHAFRYVLGKMVDVGALQPANLSEGHGINGGGLVAGSSYVEGFVPHAFLATATLSLIDLGTLGGEYSDAWDINDKGRVTGDASTKSEDVHAFVWTSSGGMRDIGTLGGSFSQGRSINASGQVAGESRIGSGDTVRAFRYTEGAGMINLGALPGGSNSHAYGINDDGQVVGESDIRPVFKSRTQLESISFEGPHAFLWASGAGMKDLGDLGGGASQAFAISNNAMVVGTSTLVNGTDRAFLWTQVRGMIDLNTLLPPDSGWVLIAAWGVNDKGQIAGVGLHNGAKHAFRYNPPGLLSPSG
jgi:probable HAF family extracellular repeat protein